MSSSNLQRILPEGSLSARRGRCGAALVAAVLTLAVAAVAGIPPDEVSVELPVYTLPDDMRVIEERWSYKLAWGAIPVGSAVISGVDRSAGGISTQGVKVTASTNSFTDLLWRYRLSADGELRVGPFAPRFFHIEESERRREKITRIDFDEQRHVRTVRRKGEKTTQYEFDGANTFDVLSTTWMFLNLDYEIGSTYEVDTLTGTSRYLVTIVAEAEEDIEVCGQEVATYRLLATTSEITDPVGKEKHRETSLWVSKTRPRRLLRARAKTFWGSITLDVTEIADLSGEAAAHRAEVTAALPELCGPLGDAEKKQRSIRRPLGPRRFHR